MNPNIQKIIQNSIETKTLLLADENRITNIHKIIELITHCFQNGNKVLFCGNGGSAADAQHLAAEFSGRFYKDRKALPSEALHCNSSYITAVGNDYAFEFIFSRMIEGIGRKGDVLVGLSTSGNSKNIINAFQKAQELEMITVGLTGESGGKMKELSTVLINVPSNDTPRIQETHILVGHIICQLVEEALFP